MRLTVLDWAIIASYFAVNVGIGLYYRKRATASTEDFFVSGRNVSWWLAGTSMVATTFAADTPLAVTGLRFELAPGDCLALFSDGVTEAQNRADEEFGEERLAEIVRSSADAPSETIVARIFDAIDAFAGDAPQFDDITLLVIKRQG